MPLKPFRGFLGPAGTEAACTVNDEDLICFFLSKPETPNARVDYWMRGTPGLDLETTFADAGAGRIRGALGLNGYVVMVSGSRVYIRDFATDAWSLIPGDPIADTGDMVAMAANKTQIFIVGGGKGYIVEVGAVHIIADPDFPGNVAGQVAMGAAELDGYFITIGKSTVAAEASLAKFYICTLNDGNLWDSLEFGSVSISANSLVAVLTDHRRLWVFGTLVTQAFVNTSNVDFPFEPIAGGETDQGLVAPDAYCSMDNTPWWLGANAAGQGTVWRGSGYLPLRVSTPAVQTFIKNCVLTDAIMWTTEFDSTEVLVLTFPTSQKTLGYIPELGAAGWFQWPYFDTPTGLYQAHRGSCHAFQDGIHFVGDRSLPKVYRMSLSTYTDAEATIRRVRTCANTVSGMLRVFYHAIRFDMQKGMGLVSGQGSDPTMLFRYSDDGGQTWSDYETLNVGKIGEYDPPYAEATRMGSGYNRVFQIVCTDPIPWYFSQALLDATEGTT